MPQQKTVYAVIAITIQSDNLSDDELIEELNECAYEFPSTENVKIISTDWMDTTTECPIF